MSDELVHETDAQRYVLRRGDTIAALVDYRINGNAISFTHTFTQPALRGQGLAARVVEFAVNDVESGSTRRVVPMCWYVADWFEANPDRGALLTR